MLSSVPHDTCRNEIVQVMLAEEDGRDRVLLLEKAAAPAAKAKAAPRRPAAAKKGRR